MVALWAPRAVPFADVRRGLEESLQLRRGKGVCLGINGFLFNGLLIFVDFMSCRIQASL